jgi:ABC-2 type transport system permease protein
MSAAPAASVSPAQAAPVGQARQAGFGHYMLAEWTKIRSVRSTAWTLILFVIITIGLAALITWVTEANWNGPHAAARDIRAVSDPTSIIFGAAIYLGQLTIAVLGVLVISTEYSTGVIRSSLLAVPKRLPMLAAKVTVFSLIMVVLAEIVVFASFFVGAAILHPHVSVSLSDTDVLRATIGAGLYLVVFGLFSMGIGALVRHTAGAVAIAVCVAFVLPILTGFLPSSSPWDYINAYLPVQAGTQVFVIHPTANPNLLSAWEGFGVLCIWAAVMLALAAYFLDKRDA